MHADGWTAARRVAAGLFYGLLVGAILSWVTFTILAAVLPQPVRAQRTACVWGAPGQRQVHRFPSGSCQAPGRPGIPGNGHGGFGPQPVKPPAT